MITLRTSSERGHVKEAWLESFHTFSFASYYDPQQMGFRSLRVINEDWVQPGSGFPLHPHRDMEILTVVISGRLQHTDDHGGKAVIGPGEVQLISAGRGIRHSEENPATDEPVHLLQIWILPARSGLTPAYAMARVAADGSQGMTCLAAGEEGQGALLLHQDARVHAGRLSASGAEQYPLATHRHAWLQLISGDLSVNGTALATGDGAAVSGEGMLELGSRGGAYYLLFDLA
jgi:quercetin 2,3-dioxygenase